MDFLDFINNITFLKWFWIITGGYFFILFVCWLNDMIEKYGLDRDIF